MTKWGLSCMVKTIDRSYVASESPILPRHVIVAAAYDRKKSKTGTLTGESRSKSLRGAVYSNKFRSTIQTRGPSSILNPVNESADNVSVVSHTTNLLTARGATVYH